MNMARSGTGSVIEGDDPTANSDTTFPRLLLANAVRHGPRPAYRHKDRGIWQTTTWAQLAPIVRGYAAGLARLGLRRGDTCGIIGGNRPRLYWTFAAVQMALSR
jgi:long-chain acyl-CoA synthetase